jgi:hypothetical protein
MATTGPNRIAMTDPLCIEGEISFEKKKPASLGQAVYVTHYYY